MTINAEAAAEQDRPGVHSLHRFSFAVPDIDAAAAYYSDFGLRVTPNGGGIDIASHPRPGHVAIRIVPGERKQVRYVLFGAYAEDMQRFRARLEALAIPPSAAPEGEDADALWFRDPGGMLVGIAAVAKTMPDSKTETPQHRGRPGERAAPMRAEVAQVRPERLAHALFFCPDIVENVAFYAETLGLRLSDMPGMVAFMHGIHGSDHHLIAFAQSPGGIGYHHSAWDVPSFEDVGRGAMQMAQKGFDRGWGFGRHVLGSNYFHYVRDPWGSYAEYSYDIDYIPDGVVWEASYPDPENSLFLWGPLPPEDFVHNYEAGPFRPAAPVSAEGRMLDVAMRR